MAKNKTQAKGTAEGTATATEVPTNFTAIYLDTNLLFGEWPKLSARLETILTLSAELRVATFLPEPVELELKRQWDERYASLSSELLKRHRDFGSIFEGVVGTIFPQVTLPSLAEAQKGYNTFVEERCRLSGIIVAPLAEITTTDLLRKAVYKALAFEEAGKGFQDTLIFLTTVQHAKAHAHRAVLVSKDGIFSKRKETLRRFAKQQGVDLDIAAEDGLLAGLRKMQSAKERRMMQRAESMVLSAFENDKENAQAWLDEFLKEHKWRSMVLSSGVEVTTAKLQRAVRTNVPWPVLTSTVRVSIVVSAELRIIPVQTAAHRIALMNALSGSRTQTSPDDRARTVPIGQEKIFGPREIELEATAQFNGSEFKNLQYLTVSLIDDLSGIAALWVPDESPDSK